MINERCSDFIFFAYARINGDLSATGKAATAAGEPRLRLFLSAVAEKKAECLDAVVRIGRVSGLGIANRERGSGLVQSRLLSSREEALGVLYGNAEKESRLYAGLAVLEEDRQTRALLDYLSKLISCHAHDIKACFAHTTSSKQTDAESHVANAGVAA